MSYIDIHSHLNLPQFDDDREEVVARLAEGRGSTIVVGVDRKSSESAVSIADQYDNVFASIGVHPEDGVHETFDSVTYAALAQSTSVVCVGECGIDYYRLDDTHPDAAQDKKRQEELFAAQIDFALSHNLPLMLHCRPSMGTIDAYEDALAILKTYPDIADGRAKGNAHFFVGNTDIARAFLEIGFTVSFTGVVTFTHDYDAVVAYVPLNMLHAETDAPFVAPKPYRGKRNEPAYVTHVVERIAEIKGTDLDAAHRQLAENAARVFGVGADTRLSS